MSTVTAIAKSTDCSNLGGVKLAYATDYSNVTGVTVSTADQSITGFTMAGSGDWSKLEFDDEDNVAFFNEEGADSVSGPVLVNGTGLMKFNGISQAKITAANKAKACCGLVVIWVGYDGTRRVQGIVVNPSTLEWSYSKRLPRFIPNILSDTGENAARLEYNVPHQGEEFAPTTTLTTTEIEAL